MAGVDAGGDLLGGGCGAEAGRATAPPRPEPHPRHRLLRQPPEVHQHLKHHTRMLAAAWSARSVTWLSLAGRFLGLRMDRRRRERKALQPGMSESRRRRRRVFCSASFSDGPVAVCPARPSSPPPRQAAFFTFSDT